MSPIQVSTQDSDEVFTPGVLRPRRLERWLPPLFFALICIFTSYDIISDLDEKTTWEHLSSELSITLISLFGFFYFFSRTSKLKKHLLLQYNFSRKSQAEALAWQQKHQTLLKGFGEAIEQQLTVWKLSPAEKEIAFFLLKGLSLNEIAELRQVSEKTIKLQASTLYNKSGLSGRAELSAFFLEDILAPIAKEN